MHFQDVLDDNGNRVMDIVIDFVWDHGPQFAIGYAKKDVGAGPVKLSEGEKERLPELHELIEGDEDRD